MAKFAIAPIFGLSAIGFATAVDPVFPVAAGFADFRVVVKSKLRPEKLAANVNAAFDFNEAGFNARALSSCLARKISS